MYLINNFLLFSIIGHIFESILFIITNNDGYSGILYGPYTPIYGFGIIIIIIINKIIDKFDLNLLKKVIISFFIYAIFLSLIEWIGGILIEIIFHKVFWDYSHLKFNIGPYIALEIAVAWGVISCIYLFLIKKITDKLIRIIPNFISYAILIIMFIDIFLKLIKTTL